MKGICYIIGALECEKIDIIVKEDDYVIAADGGYNTLSAVSIKPNMIIGDFDSICNEGKFEEDILVERYPVKKDDTDVMLAVKEGMKRGYERYVMYGVLGGSLDHTFANIQILAYMSKRGLKVKLVGKDSVMTAVTNGELRLKQRTGGRISVFSHSDSARGVTIKGLMYEVENATLKNEIPLGVSNEFVGREGSISVKDGTLVVIYEKEN